MSIHSRIVIFTVFNCYQTWIHRDVLIGGLRSRLVYDINLVQSAQEHLLGGHARQSDILKRVCELGLRR